MVSKIEIIMILAIATSLFVGINLQMKGEALKRQDEQIKKSVEVINPVGREVNSTEVANFYQASKAILIKDVWEFENFKFHNSDIKSLVAKKATKDKQFIKLIDSVKMERFDGSKYRANLVVYDTKIKRVFSEGYFQADKNGSWVKGVDFDYMIKEKLTFAKKVSAHYIVGSIEDSRKKQPKRAK